jgi:hypothetical protein
MTLKTGILAAAAALTLAVPAAALAQPGYGYGYNDGFRAAPAYGRYDDFRATPAYGRYDDYRRIDRQREWRREQELRRLRWERERAYRGDYGNYGYGR